MKFLTMTVRRRDLRAAQDLLLRGHLNAVVVSRAPKEEVYRIPVDEARLSDLLRELKRCVKSFSLCSISGSESDAPDGEETILSFRAAGEPPEEGAMALRGMFGFKKLDEP